MARYVLVSTDTADKAVKAGPILWDGTSPLDIATDRMAILATAAASAGYTFPPRPVTELNRTTLRRRVATSVTTNATYLGLPTPRTNAQIATQVEALTRQNTALIRLMLELLDTTEGT